MEIYKLSSSTFEPVEIVTGLSSYHWEDKFTSAGTFTLESPNVKDLMNQIPPETYLGNSDDDTVMFVEKHSVTTDDMGVPKLTVSGRSGQAFLEARFAVNSMSAGTEEDRLDFTNMRVYEVMRAVIRASWKTPPSFGYILDFPYRYIQPSTAVGPVIDRFESPRQSVFKVLSDLSEAYGVSFRMLRTPGDPGSAPILMSFMPGYIRTNPSNPMFSYKNGDVLNEQFVWDITNKADYVRAFTPIWYHGYGKTNYRGDYIHRAKMVDRSESEPKDLITYGNLNITDPVQWVMSLMESLNNVEILNYQKDVAQSKARLYYEASRKTKKYSFDISPTAKAKYGTDYNLGDVVTVQSSFFDAVEMRVSSYIRTMDESGHNEYPVLEEYDPLNERMELD